MSELDKEVRDGKQRVLLFHGHNLDWYLELYIYIKYFI